MKNKWTSTKLIAIGSIAVIRLLVDIIVYYSALTATSSVFGSLTIFILGPIFQVFVALVIQRFGSVTLFLTLNFLMELPTPTVFPKLILLFSTLLQGLMIDITWLIFKKNNKLFGLVSGFLINAFWVLLAILLYFSIGLYGTEHIPKIMVTPLWLFILGLFLSLIGSACGYAALSVYNKIKNTSVIKRIQR
ncbi:MAG: hypothetical protein ABIJ34_05070 [archaeon]